MDYFTAVQEGKKRVNQAINMLQGVAGPSYPMLFLKIGITDWTPVGEEMLQKVVPGKNSSAAVVICDGEGNSKAMSTWVPEANALEFSKSLELKGIPVYPGDVKLPI